MKAGSGEGTTEVAAVVEIHDPPVAAASMRAASAVAASVETLRDVEEVARVMGIADRMNGLHLYAICGEADYCVGSSAASSALAKELESRNSRKGKATWNQGSVAVLM